MFNDVAAIVMVDKLYILKSPNQLAVVNVGSCVAPVPVTYKQGALSELPPVVPTVNVLVTVVSDRNPPATCAGPAAVTLKNINGTATGAAGPNAAFPSWMKWTENLLLREP